LVVVLAAEGLVLQEGLEQHQDEEEGRPAHQSRREEEEHPGPGEEEDRAGDWEGAEGSSLLERGRREGVWL